MDPDPELDPLLRALARRRPPPAPPRLEAAVWREIRARQQQAAAGWTFRLAALLWRPAPAFAALGLACLVGVSAALWGADGRAGADPLTASRSLHLESFAPDAPGLPATLLTRR